MSGPEFFQTPMGRRFYESTMPRIADGIEKLLKVLEKLDNPMLGVNIDDKYDKLKDAAEMLCCQRGKIESALIAANMTGCIHRLRDVASLVGMGDVSESIGFCGTCGEQARLCKCKCDDCGTDRLGGRDIAFS